MVCRAIGVAFGSAWEFVRSGAYATWLSCDVLSRIEGAVKRASAR